MLRRECEVLEIGVLQKSFEGERGDGIWSQVLIGHKISPLNHLVGQIVILFDPLNLADHVREIFANRKEVNAGNHLIIEPLNLLRIRFDQQRVRKKDERSPVPRSSKPIRGEEKFVLEMVKLGNVIGLYVVFSNSSLYLFD